MEGKPWTIGLARNIENKDNNYFLGGPDAVLALHETHLI